MQKIKSFTVDHLKLLPGLYVSREDYFDGKPIITFDVRLTRPNFEPVMNTGEIHTIEHLGATYLRNREGIKERVVYWGPMGCRTGFYLILSGKDKTEDVLQLMTEVFEFIRDFSGPIPGATPIECGNYSDMDLPGAKQRAKNYLEVISKQPMR